MKTKEELLEELCLSQYNTLRFINKVMFETTKYQRSLPENEKNLELLDLAWSTNDIIMDHPNEFRIQSLLEEHYGMKFKKE